MIRALFLSALTLMGTMAPAQNVVNGTGAVLRALDKINDDAVDINLRTGSTATFGHITVELLECRYPKGNPAGEAYANLIIRDHKGTNEVFSGWMVSTSPAMNALEHRRYDVWVLRCKTD